MSSEGIKRDSFRLDRNAYDELRREVLRRDGWRCQYCGNPKNLQIHHLQLRSKLGADTEPNLITLCDICHSQVHGGSHV